MPHNNNQHYLPEEDSTIIRMVKEGCEPWVIAEKLGRTEVTLYYRRRLLGVSPGPWPHSRKYQRMKEARRNEQPT
jgi:TfoX/Sxy family transcriptional regulator of competence genes